MAYLEILQLRHNVCPDLVPIDDIASMLRVRTSRTCSRSLVVTLVGLLRVQCQAGELPGKGLCWLHRVVYQGRDWRLAFDVVDSPFEASDEKV